MALKDDLLAELDALIADGQRLDASYRAMDWGTRESSLPEVEFQTFVTAARAAVDRIAGKANEFYASVPKQVPDRIAILGYGGSVVPVITGALLALRRAVAAGLLVSLEARLRANVYDDFLVQADALFSAGYHVPAVVLAAGVLEDHLRKLCDARSLTWKGDGSLSKFNDLLYAANVYPKTILSRVQGIAHVRNDAAHGKGATVKADDVADAISFIRRFLADYAA